MGHKKMKKLTPIPETLPFPPKERRVQGKIIGIGGQKENGKSTLAHILLDLLDSYTSHGQLDPSIRGSSGLWCLSKLSHPVKVLTARLLGVDLAFIEAHKDSPPPPGWKRTIRWFLELIGNGGTEACPDLWVRMACEGCHTNVVSDDIRRVVELEKIKSLGGSTILVWRPGKENNSRVKSESGLNPLLKIHINSWMETHIDGKMNIHPLIDFFIVNTGSKERLRIKAKKIIEGIFGQILERDNSDTAAS